MKDFEPLIGTWHGEGEVPIEPPMKVASDASIQRFGDFVLFRSVGHPAEVPDTVAIIGGAPDGEPQPMHYFDSRGVKRLFMTALAHYLSRATGALDKGNAKAGRIPSHEKEAGV